MTKAITHRNIHPFPARMAPEIAIDALSDLNTGEIVLDPMVGSGTVLHHAARSGHKTIGFDLDPLAILMSKVRTSKVNFERLDILYEEFCEDLKATRLSDIYMPWIDDDAETKEFISYWFGKKQSNALRKIAYLIHTYSVERGNSIEIEILRLSLSRIVITKKVGASLAWDISHSRPHKVRHENDYDVIEGFKSAFLSSRKLLYSNQVVQGKSRIRLGDARELKLPDNSVDKVITSPPYLNAIDYMRGHKFSLIWLGYSISQLRAIRSNTVGVEKKIDSELISKEIEEIYNSVLDEGTLQAKQRGMIKRYIHDSINVMAEIARVLKPNKEAVFVIGNSNLNGKNVENSEIFKHAAMLKGLRTVNEIVREIPIKSRYLPISLSDANALNKRMKHEVILTFRKSMEAPR